MSVKSFIWEKTNEFGHSLEQAIEEKEKNEGREIEIITIVPTKYEMFGVVIKQSVITEAVVFYKKGAIL